MCTKQMIAGLHAVVNEMKKTFGLQKVRILDVPCGDMVWMSRFLKARDDVDYTGFDIVPDLIEHHRLTYADQPWTFRTVDIVTDTSFVNSFDLIVSRFMMLHLDSSAIISILQKLSTETRHPSFLFATTFSHIDINREVKTWVRGRGRSLNLEIAPYRLEPPLCIIRDGYLRPEAYMGLWRLPLMTIPESLCSKPAKFSTSLSKKKIVSCVNWQLPAHARNTSLKINGQNSGPKPIR